MTTHESTPPEGGQPSSGATASAPSTAEARPVSTRKKNAMFIYLFGALGGLNWGYDTGVISAALVYLRRDFELSSWVEGWVVTGLIVGAVLGAAVGGRLSDRYGRWKVLFATAVIFIIAPLGMAWAPEAVTLFIFRFVAGLGAGLTAVILPVYLSEIAPAKIRGKVTALYTLAIVSGQFLGFIIGLAFAPLESWRWMLGLSVVPSLLFAVGLFFIWETPRWLVLKGRDAEARQVLLYDRTPDEAEREYAEIRAIHEAEKAAGGTTLKVLMEPWVRPILFVGLGLAILQQIMGINTIIYYAPTVLQNVGFTDQAAIAANLIIGVMNVLAICLALRYADRWGRKPLLMAGAVGTFLSLGILAAVNLLLPAPDGFGFVGIVTLTCMALYIFLFQMSWGSIVWVMLGEIFPLGIRAAAMGVATTALWLANGVVALGFPPVLEALGIGVLFAGFSVICFIAILFTWKAIPETKGRSLEEIEERFKTGVMPTVSKVARRG
ncbi:sugar porter family MFS transporter [Nesterenkonia aerolata]|uniref:Sugar porter family MFS transporter n=1 Tax=Nesterenkonia aerolata TaxID=3074079 RepID=A0ABU2DU32_9MICC|nr:sugar porter family MFS transporter [Nesterenkonia sp. LY-0111]MDR8020000.1 sugar porter family MFS transporter [Nesterenkonia sp. LY-0111]